MKIRNTLFLFCFLPACTSSNEGPTNSTPDVASESVKEVFIERQKEQDTIPPSPESEAHYVELIKRAESSEYRGLKDTEFEPRLRGWIADYKSSCDTAVFNRFKNAISKDLNFQAWVRKNHEKKEELWSQLKAVRENCKAGK